MINNTIARADNGKKEGKGMICTLPGNGFSTTVEAPNISDMETVDTLGALRDRLDDTRILICRLANDAIELSRTDGRDEFTHYNRQLFVSDCALLLPLLEDRLELAVLTLKLAGRSLDKKRLQQQEGDVSSDCSSA